MRGLPNHNVGGLGDLGLMVEKLKPSNSGNISGTTPVSSVIPPPPMRPDPPPLPSMFCFPPPPIRQQRSVQVQTEPIQVKTEHRSVSCITCTSNQPSYPPPLMSLVVPKPYSQPPKPRPPPLMSLHVKRPAWLPPQPRVPPRPRPPKIPARRSITQSMITLQAPAPRRPAAPVPAATPAAAPASDPAPTPPSPEPMPPTRPNVSNNNFNESANDIDLETDDLGNPPSSTLTPSR